MALKTRERSSSKSPKRFFTISLVASFAACVALLSTTDYAREMQNKIKHRLFGRFTLHQVEWREIGDGNLKAFVTPELLWKVSELKKDMPLIDIDLADLEKKLKTIPWIESVDIQKHLSLGIAVQYKTHRARAVVIQNRRPWLFSESGTAIAAVEPSDLAGNSFLIDLPVLTGFQDAEQALQWLGLLEGFTKSSEIAGRAEVHEIAQYRHEIRGLIALRYRNQNVKANVIFLNTDPNGEFKNPDEIAKEITRLKKTVQYLINNNILVSSFDLRTGQKVVVNVGKRL